MTFTLTGAELAQIILALATLVAAAGAALQASRASAKVDTVHAAVNGQTAHLVALTAASSYAQGALSAVTPPPAVLPIGVMGVAGAPPPPPGVPGDPFAGPTKPTAP